MAYQRGVIETKFATVLPLTVESFTKNESSEIYELRDGQNKVKHLAKGSTAVSISVTGAINTTESLSMPSAGDALTISGITYIIESIDINESSGDWLKATINAKTADSATILELE